MRKYHSPKDYLDAARSPDTSTDELRRLAQSPYDFVRLAVAGNPNVASDILASLVPEEFSSWNGQALAAALAANLKTPAEVLAALAVRLTPVLDHGRGNGMGFEAALRLCSNPNTPLAAIEEMLRCAKVATLFRKAVAKRAGRADVIDLLLSDRSSVVQKQARLRSDVLRAGGADLERNV